MVSIKNLNDDVLKHILGYTEQTLKQKIDEIDSIPVWNRAMKHLKQKQRDLRVKLSLIMKKNSVFWLKYENNEMVDGLFLIQNANLNKNNDTIKICSVKPSLEKRIFGYYEITGLTVFITSNDLIEYELLYQHKEPPFIGNDYFGVMFTNPNYIHFDHLIEKSNKVILGQIRKITKTKITLILDYHQIVDTRPLNDWTYMKFNRSEVFNADIEFTP